VPGAAGVGHHGSDGQGTGETVTIAQELGIPTPRALTSENSVRANLGECPKGEVRRIPLLRTPVNKGLDTDL
jgi:hypothetical protein